MVQQPGKSMMLSTTWRLVLRVVYFATLAILLFFLFTGIAAQVASYTVATIGVGLPENENGEVVLEVYPDSDAMAAGLESGDIVLAINGHEPRETEEERLEQLQGAVGGTVSLVVRKGDGSESSYTVTRWQNYANALAEGGLTPESVGGFYATVGVVTALVFAVLGAVLVMQKQADWRMVMGGFAILLFAYSLNAAQAAYLGAQQVNLAWLYNILRAAGLFLTCTGLLVLPTGKFVPGWTKWVVVLMAVWMIPYLVALWVRDFLPGAVLDIVWMAFLAVSILMQVVRRARFANADEKQVTRPMVVGAIAALVVYLFIYISSRAGMTGLFPAGARWWYFMTSELVLDAALLAFGFGWVRCLLKAD